MSWPKQMDHRVGKALLLAVPLAATVALGASARPQQSPKRAAPPSAKSPFDKDVAPLVRKYCLSCHTAPKGAGGINLSREKDFAAVLKRRDVWDRVAPAVLERRMPPEGVAQPTLAERERLGGALESYFSKIDCQINDPGRVTMRRLNRAEYNNTIRDLLGVYLRPADDFPNDDVGYGFDNIGDVLSISPLLMEKYLAAAEAVARDAIRAPGTTSGILRAEARSLSGTGATSGTGSGFQLGRTGDTATAAFDLPAAGVYTLRVSAYGDQAPPEPARMALFVGQKRIATVDVPNEVDKPLVTQVAVTIDQPGRVRFGARFLNNNDIKTRKIDRNLYINYVELELPRGVRQGLSLPSPSDDSLAAWDATARKFLAPLGKRAFRRPLTSVELNGLVRLTHLARERKVRSEFPDGIRLAVQALLSSPSFLFRPEPDARPNDPTARRQLNDYELATRLSYFLWSSMPDRELMDLADQGKLRKPAVLIAQTRRMLRDPKANALAENFAGQWLQLRKLSQVQPDDKTFREPLRQAMATEPTRFFEGVVREDRSVLEFLDANYTYVNGTLAKHYGIPDVQGETFRKVILKDGNRGGLLSMAGVLTLTSNPNRTSPVKRGKWVLDNLLGTPPPPPPPNVPELDKPGKPVTGTTLRQRLEVHRANPACANCHAKMDAIGLALENYDLIGRWRQQDAGLPIDASGVLPDGSAFNGPKELKKVLLGKKRLFTRTLAERLLTYALGRGMERTDRCNLDTLAKAVEARGHRFSALVEAVVTSQPFRERRGDESGRKLSQR